MTRHGFITMGLRPTRSTGMRLSTVALLFGTALVLVSVHDVHARTKDGFSREQDDPLLQRCWEGKPNKDGQCPSKRQGAKRASKPSSRTSSLSMDPDPAQPDKAKR